MRPGIYTGLNVAANWDKINVEGPVYVGGMTKIEDGATIVGPAMIGPSCHICAGATIDNSIIFDYSRIGAGVTLSEKLVFGRYCVDKTGDHLDAQEASLDWLITDARRLDLVEPSRAESLGRALGFRPGQQPWGGQLLQHLGQALFGLHCHQVHPRGNGLPALHLLSSNANALQTGFSAAASRSISGCGI